MRNLQDFHLLIKKNLLFFLSLRVVVEMHLPTGMPHLPTGMPHLCEGRRISHGISHRDAESAGFPSPDKKKSFVFFEPTGGRGDAPPHRDAASPHRDAASL